MTISGGCSDFAKGKTIELNLDEKHIVNKISTEDFYPGDKITLTINSITEGAGNIEDDNGPIVRLEDWATGKIKLYSDDFEGPASEAPGGKISLYEKGIYTYTIPSEITVEKTGLETNVKNISGLCLRNVSNKKINGSIQVKCTKDN